MPDAAPAAEPPAERPAGEIPPDLTERIRSLRDALMTGLVERDVAIRLALIASLAGEHLLLLGPPGTAKSLVARRLRQAFSSATYFERLLTRFTVPEELFGPLSIKGLEEDRYERLTEAYLPQAAIAFLDEIFKANSAILNSLLTLLNEREFDNGKRREKTPLIAVVGASNELPQDGELEALFDRFLLRLHVGPVSKDAFPDLLGLRGEPVPEVSDELKLTAADLEAVQRAAEAVQVPDDVTAMLCDLRDWCTAEEIAVSDRRWRKVVKLLQVSALTNGRDAVSVWDAWLLQHCLWDTPEDREKVYEWYATRVGASAAMDPARLTRIVVAWEARLERDRHHRSHAMNHRGELLYTDVEGNKVASPKGLIRKFREDETLYVAQPDWLNSNRRQLNENQYSNDGEGYTEDELSNLQVPDDEQGTTRFRHWRRKAKYLQSPSSWYCVEGDLDPVIEATRHKQVYVRDCLREVDGIAQDVSRYQAHLGAHIESLREIISNHLWVPAGFAVPALSTLRETEHQVAILQTRVQEISSGLEMLPVEPDVQTASADGEEG